MGMYTQCHMKLKCFDLARLCVLEQFAKIHPQILQFKHKSFLYSCEYFHMDEQSTNGVTQLRVYVILHTEQQQ